MQEHLGFGYAVKPSATQASVGGFVVGVGFTCAFVPLGIAMLLATGPETRWPYVVAGLALMSVQIGVMSVDLVRLLGASFRAPSPVKTVVELSASMTALMLIGVGLGGLGADIYRWLLIPSVLIAATIGNRRMLTTVVIEALILAVGPAALQGADLTSLIVFAGAFSAVALAAAAIVTETRDAGIRAADRFDRLTETTEVILRADAFEDALARFLPLVAAQVGTDQISVFMEQPDDLRIELDGLGTPHEMTSRIEWMPPAEGANGFDIQPKRTYAWARGTDGRVAVVVIHRHEPGWRRRVSFHAALRQLAPELELLLQHTDLLVQLDRRGRTDTLTGLPNRLELIDRITQERARASRSGEPLVVAMIDLDEFKSYNDSFGHLEGDHALASLGQLFLARLRAGDFVCRYGGEEFFFVMPNTSLEGASFVLDQLRTLAGALPAARPLSFSAGIAMWEHPETNDQLIVQADNALYEAKAAGRHTTVAAPPRHHDGESPSRHSNSGCGAARRE